MSDEQEIHSGYDDSEFKDFVALYKDARNQKIEIDAHVLRQLLDRSESQFRSYPNLNTVISCRLWLIETFDSWCHNIDKKRWEGLPFDTAQDLIQADLNMNAETLASNLKSYSAWEYRRRLLELSSHDDREDLIKGDIEITKELLDLDHRNFHAWNHYRWLMCSLKNTNSKEVTEKRMQFAQKIINQCFGNYSAWHERLVVIKQSATIGALCAELPLVQSAMYCDPNDECAFLYAESISRLIFANAVSSAGDCNNGLDQYERWLEALIDSAFDLIEMEETLLRFPLQLLSEIARQCKEMVEAFPERSPWGYFKKVYLLEKYAQEKIPAGSNLGAYESVQHTVLHCLLQCDPMRRGMYTDFLQQLDDTPSCG